MRPRGKISPCHTKLVRPVPEPLDLAFPFAWLILESSKTKESRVLGLAVTRGVHPGSDVLLTPQVAVIQPQPIPSLGRAPLGNPVTRHLRALWAGASPGLLGASAGNQERFFQDSSTAPKRMGHFSVPQGAMWHLRGQSTGTGSWGSGSLGMKPPSGQARLRGRLQGPSRRLTPF